MQGGLGATGAEGPRLAQASLAQTRQASEHTGSCWHPMRSAQQTTKAHPSWNTSELRMATMDHMSGPVMTLNANCAAGGGRAAR